MPAHPLPLKVHRHTRGTSAASSPTDTFQTVLRFETTTPPGWDDFVNRHPSGAIYHTSLWTGAICRTYGYEPLYLTLVDRQSQIVAGMPAALIRSRVTGNRIVSFPFSDFCGPVATDPTDAEILTAALQRKSVLLGASYVESRMKAIALDPQAPDAYVLHELCLEQDLDRLFASLHKDCLQRSIRKAERRNIRVSVNEDGSLEKFYRLHCITRKRQGVPVQPFRFFQTLWESLHPAGRAELLLAYCENRHAAALLVIYSGGAAYYKYGASDARFNATGANQLLMWEAIRRAHGKGCKVFDFGRTSVGNPSLRQYKNRWGAHETPLCYTQTRREARSSAMRETSPVHRVIKALFRHVPVSLNRLAGELLYKHLG